MLAFCEYIQLLFAGPMFIVGRHAYFQLFVIDPRVNSYRVQQLPVITYQLLWETTRLHGVQDSPTTCVPSLASRPLLLAWALGYFFPSFSVLPLLFCMQH